MQMLLYIVPLLPFALLFYFAFKYSGYRKGNIVLHLDEWYKDHGKYVKAIEKELREQGKEAYYMGKFRFVVEGKRYKLNPIIETVGGVPVQRTILEPDERMEEENG
ncbi:hypothetical protein LCM20_15880 [Halobacillus litoralis]|uniref:hypothetical protein n=1 Tax=Halobacillus litoralis TaxID=45668 RepID=UPI001CD46175|nr:hypothetical protein [Halobacillus litoralis]MCA0972087.1 hypothetical protein [Halobacillus litoralis]